MATFGERLKYLRKEKQLTVEELASKLGSAKSTISRYENNLRDPKRDFLEILSNFFDVSVDYLLGKSDIKNVEKQNEHEEKVLQVFEEYKNLSEENKEIIIQLIKNLNSGKKK